MAKGDITKVIKYDKIEVINDWNIQLRQATILMEEQDGGSKEELTKTFHREVIVPFVTTYSVDSGGKRTYTHTDTDLSGYDDKTKSICQAAWTDDIKNEYKTWKEANTV